jgi:hypothetical protein
MVHISDVWADGNGTWISVGNAASGAEYVHIENCHLINAGIRWFDCTDKRVTVDNVSFFIDEGFESFLPIDGARIQRAMITACDFVKAGTVSSVTAVSINIDNFNTYIRNCNFDNFDTVTNNGTIMEDNTYANMTTTPTAWINPFLRKGYAEVEVTTKGTYYSIPGTTDSGVYDLRVRKLGDSTGSVGKYTTVRRDPGSAAATIITTAELPAAQSWDLRSNVGDNDIKITQDVLSGSDGDVAEIMFDYV